MKKEDYQKTSNKLCLSFGMNPIPVMFYKRKSRVRGTYHGEKIMLNVYNHQLNISTLLHELGHYLHQYRFEAKFRYYYTMELWNSMQPVKDKPGWYSATGKPEPVYFIGPTHGKAFKNCYYDIRQTYKRTYLVYK